MAASLTSDPSGAVLDAVQRAHRDVADNPHSTLARLRAEAPSFVPTWLSARSELPGGLEAELEVELNSSRQRTQQFADIVADLGATFGPALRPVKGVEIVDLYPSPLARHMNDIDLVADSLATLDNVVVHLRERHGFSLLKSAATFPCEDGQARIVSVEHPPASPHAQRLNVEVTDAAFIGDGATVPSRRTWPERYGPPAGGFGLVGHFQFLAAEALEGPLGLKDLTDAWLVWNALALAAETQNALELADELDLLPEAAKLVEQTDAAGYPLTQELTRRMKDRARWALLRRRTQYAKRSAASPVVWGLQSLQRSEALPCRGRGARQAVWRAIDRRVPPGATIRRRLWGFGLPAEVDEEAAKVAVVHTPLGDLVAVNAGAVDQRWAELKGVRLL